MAELKQDFARMWVEFDDPADSENLFRCDLTWLTSSWNCIYGRGCGGIVEGKAANGCCSLGAHFSDDGDYDRVKKYVGKLDKHTWENYKEGHKKWTEKDDDGETKTRVYKGGCIFLNSADFATGGGCALHQLAARENISITKTKPDVCWQLPIQREFEWINHTDGNQRLKITIGEYTRAGWGAGGSDLHWYCTSNTEAHIAANPVYLTERDTLVELMGEPAYKVLVEHCEARMTALRAMQVVAQKSVGSTNKSVAIAIRGLAPHPADRVVID